MRSFLASVLMPITKRNFSQSFLLSQSSTKAVKSQLVTMIPGDGIGPEMMEHVKSAVSAIKAPVSFETVSLSKTNNSDEAFRACLSSVLRNRVALKGNLEAEHKLHKATADGAPSRNVQLRTQLDLFASLIHARTIPGVRTPLSPKPGQPLLSSSAPIDIVLIRENTEGEYSGLEHESVPGVVESLKVVTRAKTERIAKFAFEYARTHHRKHVTIVHKANIMKLGDGLFLETAMKVAQQYAVHGITSDAQIIDNCTMQLVRRPQQFDVMLMPNLYGNIVANILAALVGGPGVVSGLNIGENCAVFESGTRSSGAKIAGLDKANPAAYLFATVDLLDYIGQFSYAERLRSAILRVLGERQVHTADIKHDAGKIVASSSEFMRALLGEIGSTKHSAH